MKQYTYVPILKWRLAEKGALLDLTIEERSHITPLIQIVHKYTYIKKPDGLKERKELPAMQVLTKTLMQIRGLSCFSKVYVDPRPLFGNNTNETLRMISNIPNTLFGSNIVPVLTLEDLETIEYGEEEKNFIQKQGICLRISRDEFNNNFFTKIDSLLKNVDISRDSVDLVIDFQSPVAGDLEKYISESSRDVSIDTWRSYIFASGAYLADLMKYSKQPGTYYVNRDDWLLWKNIYKSSHGMRKPIFADYTIQHPVYHPPINMSNPSRSLIYARKTKWVIMKGMNDKAKGSQGALQYRAHAQILIGSKLAYGITCCEGDKKIAGINGDPDWPLGSFTTWLRVGINHHLALTLRQISN